MYAESNSYAWKPLFTGKNKEDRDYVDIDQHDEYVDPEELMVGETGSTTGDSVPPTSPSSTASSSIFKPLPSKLVILEWRYSNLDCIIILQRATLPT